MKKFLSLLLCLVMSMLMLVSCGDQEIGSYKDNYPPIDNTIPEVKLNMYVIVESGTAANAKTTVGRMFAQETLSKYHTEVTLHYLTAEEYEAKTLAAVNATDATAANIVLITNKAFYDKLASAEKLADLTPYLDTDYGKLYKQIPESLMDATKVDGKFFAIPNNHVIGYYEYLVINKEAARAAFCDETDTEFFATLTSYEATAQLRQDMITLGGYTAEQVKNLVRVEKGSYEAKAQFESEGNFCNVIKYPNANADEVFSSAFAVVSRDELSNSRAMQIIYEINYNAQLRNLLQYGVSGTNYTLDEDGTVVRVDSDDNKYYMNILYTGDIFKALYCKEIGWTATVAQNGTNQNNEAVFVPVAETPAE